MNIRQLYNHGKNVLHERSAAMDEYAVNRRNVIISNCCTNVVGNMVGGNFIVGLLLLFNASSVEISYITVITYVCNVLQILSPLFLERFKKRKLMLICARGLIYFLNVILVGLIALLPSGDQFKIIAILGVIALFNTVNALTSPGFCLWHMQSIPERVRAGFFSNQLLFINLSVYVFIIAGSAVLDVFKASGNELTGHMILRIGALVFAALDMFWLLRIKEYPYVQAKEKISLKLLMKLPFKEKKYMRSVYTIIAWSFAINIFSSYYTIYLLNVLNVKYSFITIAQAMQVPVMILLRPVWVKAINRSSWLGMLYKAILLYSFGILAHSLVFGFMPWFYYVAVLYCHVFGFGVNIVMSNMYYYNIPEENQSVYLTFSMASANLASMFGVLCGTAVISGLGGWVAHIGALDFYPAQLLSVVMWACLAAAGLVCLWVYRVEVREKTALPESGDVK